MHNWDELDEGGGPGCAWEADYSDVKEVCERLGMECQKVDLIKDYWNEVFGSIRVMHHIHKRMHTHTHTRTCTHTHTNTNKLQL